MLPSSSFTATEIELRFFVTTGLIASADHRNNNLKLHEFPIEFSRSFRSPQTDRGRYRLRIAASDTKLIAFVLVAIRFRYAC
jgi:hypothetical protein